MKRYLYLGLICFMFSSCDKDWLDPKPLSFYTPENSYTSAESLMAALGACEVVIREEFMGYGAPAMTELIQSDLAVSGRTSESTAQIDMDITLLPDAELDRNDYTRVGWYWNKAYEGIKYANIVLHRADGITFESEAEKKGVVGSAYFFRAYFYYKLVHQFGNVPFIATEVTTPKTDFYTHDRWAILRQLRTDLEFAVEWMPEKVDRGRAPRGAGRFLLMKVYMALGEFDKAIEQGQQLVADYPLMTTRFTARKSEADTHIFHDLHSVEGKVAPANTEGIFYAVSYPSLPGAVSSSSMYNYLPYWESSAVTTPDGKKGTAVTIDEADQDTELDINSTYGYGQAYCRPTNYAQYGLWTEKEKNDLRGVYNRTSWKSTADLMYNHPSLKKQGSEWYGKKLVRPENLSVSDSIASWFQWPHYKAYVPTPNRTSKNFGGETPIYIFRSAEVHLLLAECYYWTNNAAQAIQHLNEVRSRAQADPLTAGTEVSIATILDERARELIMEENRHLELTRIAYTYALTQKPCEVFNGQVYDEATLCGPADSKMVKQRGYNFWWDWLDLKSNFYNKGVKTQWYEYKISVHHLLWPIPSKVIEANKQGHINQNIGYPGAETNFEPKSEL